MNDEELIRKMENLDLPEIELPAHKELLKMSLLSDDCIKLRKGNLFTNLRTYFIGTSKRKNITFSGAVIVLVSILTVTGLLLINTPHALAQGFIGKAVTATRTLTPEEVKILEEQAKADLQQTLIEAKNAKDLNIVDKSTVENDVMATLIQSGSSDGTVNQNQMNKAIPNAENITTYLRFTRADGNTVIIGLDSGNAPVWIMVEGTKVNPHTGSIPPTNMIK